MSEKYVEKLLDDIKRGISDIKQQTTHDFIISKLEEINHLLILEQGDTTIEHTMNDSKISKKEEKRFIQSLSIAHLIFNSEILTLK
jgi:hypothetical protein